jgi:dipeptidase E
MKKIFCFLLFFYALQVTYGQTGLTSPTANKTIFAYGGDMNKDFIRYVAGLTKKTRPKICFLPTAGADNPYVIGYWYEVCVNLPVEPGVLRTFINASPEQKTFEETLLSVDAIIVGGGNTLNMISIWKGQGIDTVLKKAYDKGIVLAGGSAGSLCWFQNGLSDSRPQRLTIVQCLGFIDASHCPHYSSEKTRRPLYKEKIIAGELKPGYACDDLAGLLFENGKLSKAVTLDKTNKAYYVSLKDGKIEEQDLHAELIKQ